MARPSKISWWKRGGGGFWTTHKGEQICLAKGQDDQSTNGPVYRAALNAWLDLLGAQASPDRITFRGVFQRYVASGHRDKRPGHLEHVQQLLAPFLEELGFAPVCELTPARLVAFWSSRPEWSSGTQRALGAAVKSVLAWGVDVDKCIKANPLLGAKLPRAGRRGAEFVMSDELMDAIESETYTDRARLFWRLLRYTGARPIEIREATHDRYRDGRIIHPAVTSGYRWKNAAKTGKDRVIVIPPALRPEVDALHRPGSREPIFLTARGKKWANGNQGQLWRATVERPGVAAVLAANHVSTDHVHPYGYRHTFITRWCDAGGSYHDAAWLCGTSVSQVERVYGHPDASSIESRFLAFLARQ